jgi:hypothetical protein
MFDVRTTVTGTTRASNLEPSTTRSAGTSTKRVARPCSSTAMLTANLVPTDYIATEQLLDNTPLIKNLRYSGTN